MKSIKRAIAVVLLIAMLLSVGYLGFTCKRVTNETTEYGACENTAFTKMAIPWSCPREKSERRMNDV